MLLLLLLVVVVMVVVVGVILVFVDVARGDRPRPNRMMTREMAERAGDVAAKTTPPPLLLLLLLLLLLPLLSGDELIPRPLGGDGHCHGHGSFHGIPRRDRPQRRSPPPSPPDDGDSSEDESVVDGIRQWHRHAHVVGQRIVLDAVRD